MSTISKLDPEHRQRRSNRRNMLRALSRMIQKMFHSGHGKQALRASITHQMLTDVARNPSMPAHVKDLIFAAAVSRVTA